jgi:hydrogenase nickel incorporation protein HypB
MCTTCGCGHEGEHEHQHVDEREDGRPHAHSEAAARDLRTLRLQQDLLAESGRLASETRHALDKLRISMFNLIGGPGAGKTAVLEATIPRVRGAFSVAVLEGDQATDLDATRIRRTGCPVVQINTGPGCHLDAAIVGEALRTIAPRPASVVFVENVGNLVCPALFDIGERSKVVVMSVTEGEDKPLKYAHVFRAADAFLLTKLDLLPHVVFDMERCLSYAREVNPRICILPVSALTGDGIDDWCSWVNVQASS